ncbi:MAG: hypothetical protein SO471_08270 [Anaerobutyricum hallii]|uniref:hypothetical protein n=1 Tax=Anaerobutyricum hallii TaxID=39488 RepID=UPI002A81CF7D|nr:hypothetical protein [Anaerobutyricum hallii]MDY4577946.1 hypothetical protein [Anaerobutyricum hallii]
MAIYGNPVGGALNAKTFMLEVNGGETEIAATVVGEETVFDATPNDVRTGKKFATSSGVEVGTKDIPAYRTAQGAVIIKPNENFSIVLEGYSQYDYTKLQCLISKFNTSVDDSVAVDKVVIGDNVYAVNSTIPLAAVTKDAATKSIKLNIKNESSVDYVLRYFTYREEV